VQKIVVLHPTVALRAALYMFMSGAEYGCLVSCDLVEDLDKETNVDSLLLGLRDHVLVNDEVQREWVGRKEAPSKPTLDPRKPLINTEDVDFSWNAPTAPTPGLQTSIDDI
jgi:hypothetical protein